jgi:hypothetical protein
MRYHVETLISCTRVNKCITSTLSRYIKYHFREPASLSTASHNPCCTRVEAVNGWLVRRLINEAVRYTVLEGMWWLSIILIGTVRNGITLGCAKSACHTSGTYRPSRAPHVSCATRSLAVDTSNFTTDVSICHRFLSEDSVFHTLEWMLLIFMQNVQAPYHIIIILALFYG